MSTDAKIKYKRELIYLACPYSDASATVRLQRFQQATKAAAALIRRGNFVFSPITMTHPIDLEIAGLDNTLGSEFWVAFDETFMERCDVFVLLPLEGWERSKGVRHEIEFFEAAGKPLMILDSDHAFKPLSSLGETALRRPQAP
jgi:hypothetical protein